VASTQENPVNYAKIAAALGLPAEASEDEILAAIAGMALPPPVMTAAAAALGLAEGATAEQIVTAATAAVSAEPDPAKFVPIAVVTDLQGQLATANAAITTTEAEQLIATASAEGKLTPAMQGWAKSYAGKDLVGFKAWLATAAAVVTPGQVDLETAALKANGGALTEDEKRICKLTGVSEDKFLAAKKGN
jgi:phage I-like protein